MTKIRCWLTTQYWSSVYDLQSASEKADNLLSMLLNKYKDFFPIKTHNVSSDDQPWITHKLKAQDRRKKRELNKHRKSEKWYKISKEFKTDVKSAKKEFYKKQISELMSRNTSKWYMSLKKISSHDQHKSNIKIKPIEEKN